MDASVGEPFILSTYRLPTKVSKGSKNRNPLSSIFATYHGGGGHSEGYVTVAAQGDGVHVLNLSTLHSITSHTVGPTTAFLCPAVTRSELQGADHICTTYAAVASSSDIAEDDYNRTIWMWRENLSSSIADRAAQKKKAVTLPQAISGMYLSDELPSRLLVTSPEGVLTVLHGDLQTQSTRSAGCNTLKFFVLSRKECTFLPSGSTPAPGAIMVSLTSLEGSLRIQVLAVDSEDHFHDLCDIALPIDAKTFCDLSFSKSGVFSVLVKNGTWSSFELKPTDDSLYLNPLDTTRLKSLSFIASSSSSAETTVLSLGSAHALLGGLTGSGSSREIVLLLWDLSFSVLLYSRTLPLPSNLSESKDISIALVDALSSSNAILLLSPSTSTTSDRRKSQNQSGGSSSIWVVPMSVPPTSSIANAFGRASAAIPWLAASPNGDGALSGSSVATLYDAGRTKVLKDMRTAMDRNQPQNAKSVYFEWEKGELEKQKEYEKAKEGESKDQSTLDGKPQTMFTYNFVKEVLSVLLQTSKPATGNVPYSSDIVKHLLEKKVVSGSMVDGGLLRVLRMRNDWKSIFLALTNVEDLEEVEIIECLCFILARHRQRETQRTVSVSGSSAVATDAMQVDGPPTSGLGDSTPTLPVFLGAVLRYTHVRSSTVSLRAAFRRYLSDVDDVVCLLEVLDGWMGQWAGRDIRLLPTTKMVKKNELGVFVLKDKDAGRKAEEDGDIPSMLQITTFLQSILDVSFVNLIQTPSSHHLLQKMDGYVQPQIKYIEQMDGLRGALEVFVRAQAKAIKDAKVASEGGGKGQGTTGDWRQRKKAMYEHGAMNIGLYQLEEITF
ncbi:hypothetical protein D9757_012609 [Collybiopsis confluens]|uniref:Uncharacterized protein n=1 Tax=Collybiopsis confluens TaxID=2823264 RepID=A0A8H5GI14_9AGAR|nr:hypothetical protein D9757_012609 [Collybiopsis confluens]